MVLSTFWMAEMVGSSTRGTFQRAVLYTSIVLGSFWGLLWTVSQLIPSSGIDNPHKLYLHVPLNWDQQDDRLKVILQGP